MWEKWWGLLMHGSACMEALLRVLCYSAKRSLEYFKYGTSLGQLNQILMQNVRLRESRPVSRASGLSLSSYIRKRRQEYIFNIADRYLLCGIHWIMKPRTLATCLNFG
jgi:hypothetical protein